MAGIELRIPVFLNVKAVMVVLTETNVTLQNMTDESVFHTS